MIKKPKQKSILLVEDELPLNKIIALKLTKAGYSVISANDGKKAINVLAKEKPDLLWLDLYLPKMDGFEVLEWVRANPKTKNLRVIVVSVSGNNRKMERAQQLGAIDYYIKSNYKIDELIDRVNIVLK